jgi:C4-dicarboxylate-specific signal transduction histidine kinase
MTLNDSSVVISPGSPDPNRTERRLQIKDAVGHLLRLFSRTASSAFNLPAGLLVLCHEAPAALGTGGASAWIHDRRSHELVLVASTGTAGEAEGARLGADAPRLPALALRDVRARCAAAGAGLAGRGVVSIPLRGRRRALGVLMLEDLDATQGADVEFLAEADELGRQLSAAIENLLLLDDVLRSRTELAHTFDSLEDLVAICDARLRVVHVNRTLGVRLAAPRDHLVDRPLADLLGHEAARWLKSKELSDGMRASVTDALEIEDPLLGGRFTMTLTPLPGQDGRPSGAVFVARDVTSQARLEAERTALRERLTQSEKLASLGQFIAGIAHELNNPLQGVLGHLELLRRQGRVPPGIRRELGVVAREADRAARIVGNLLVFAGGRPAPQRPLRLNTLVSQAIALRAPTWKTARIEVVRRLDESNPRVVANRVLLQQALLNVLVNAEQELAAIGGGRIVVSTRVLESGESVRLQVRDTGPGIAAEALPRLFEPFYSTKEVGRGTGLGLAITYGIVKDHHGTLAADNHPDGGAVFTLELPVVKEPRRATPPGATRPTHHG